MAKLLRKKDDVLRISFNKAGTQATPNPQKIDIRNVTIETNTPNSVILPDRSGIAAAVSAAVASLPPHPNVGANSVKIAENKALIDTNTAGVAKNKADIAAANVKITNNQNGVNFNRNKGTQNKTEIDALNTKVGDFATDDPTGVLDDQDSVIGNLLTEHNNIAAVDRRLADKVDKTDTGQPNRYLKYDNAGAIDYKVADEIADEITNTKWKARHLAAIGPVAALRGLYPTLTDANNAIANKNEGDWVLIGTSAPYIIYAWQNGQWVQAGSHQSGVAQATFADGALTSTQAGAAYSKAESTNLYADKTLSNVGTSDFLAKANNSGFDTIKIESGNGNLLRLTSITNANNPLKTEAQLDQDYAKVDLTNIVNSTFKAKADIAGVGLPPSLDDRKLTELEAI